MDPDLLRLREVLNAYIRRGRKALEALEQEQWDTFEKAMRWKKAAFLHFRALDYIVEQKQPGYLATHEWQEVWTEMEGLDRRLTDEMERAKDKLHRQIHRVTQHRAALKKFQSGEKNKTGFLDSI
jgi:hypothetical protein